MAKYKITITDDCIGCRACIATYEENFDFDEDSNKAKVKKKIIDEKELSKNNEAKDVCPVDAIKIEKVD
ncbi:MAG: ferredoxin [Nanoarchaeota archaeon]|nr:ferredoxin [Nanoarchaeota archaeon]